MSKAEKENRINSLAVTFLERQQIIPNPLADQIISAYKEGYLQAEEDLIDKTLFFLKDRLYKNGYVGIIDLCDDYIKAMKDEEIR